MKNKIYTLTVLLSFMAAISRGQVTETINYQANITQNGVPVTRTAGLVMVEIHRQGLSQHVVYTESHHNVEIRNGLMNITVGNGSIPNLGCTSCIPGLRYFDWSNNYQIRMIISPGPNQIIVPSALLHPSLIALQAVSTRQLRDTGSNMSTTNSGNFGIGVLTPMQKLDVAGAIKIGDITAPAVEGTIRYNSALGFEGFRNGIWSRLDNAGNGITPWAGSGNNIYNNNTGNVGIGVFNPGAKLDVLGPIRISGFAGGNYSQSAGTIRFESGIFEGYNGQAWVPFGGGAAPTLSVNGNQLSISGGNTVTLNSLTDWSLVGNDIYNNNSGKVTIGVANSTRPEKFQFIDATTGAYQNSAKFIRTNPYGTVLAVIDSGTSGDPNYSKAVSAHSIYGTALYGESTRAYGLKVRGGGSFYPASLIEANAGAAGLVVSSSSTTSSPQLNVEETTDGNYGRIKFTNYPNPTNSWTMAGLNTAIAANDRFNIYHSAAGDVLSITGDGKTLIKGATAFNNSFGTAGQVLQSNGNNAAPTWVTPASSAISTFFKDSMSLGLTTILIGQRTTIPGLIRTFTTTGNTLADIRATLAVIVPNMSGGDRCDVSLMISIDGVIYADRDANYLTAFGSYTIDISGLVKLAPGLHTIEIQFENSSLSTKNVQIYPTAKFARNYMDILLTNQ